MKAKRDLINSWIDKAEKGLRSALHGLSFTDVVSIQLFLQRKNQEGRKYRNAFFTLILIVFADS